jgi:hypothetical protein
MQYLENTAARSCSGLLLNYSQTALPAEVRQTHSSRATRSPRHSAVLLAETYEVNKGVLIIFCSNTKSERASSLGNLGNVYLWRQTLRYYLIL